MRSQNQPRWSPDGTKLLYLTLDGLYVAPAAGGPPRLVVARVPLEDKRTVIAVRNSLSAAAWAPDSQRIAVIDNSDKSISIVSLSDGVRRRIATSPVELHSCDWSPDSRWIACAAGNWHAHFVGIGFALGNMAASAIVLVPASGGAVQHVTDYAAMNQSPVWSAESRRIYFVSNRARVFDIYAQEISSEGRATGPPARITTGLDAWSISFSADRKRLAYAATISRANIWSLTVPRAGIVNVSSAVQLTRGNQMIESVRVSRSGKWLLYDSNLNGTFDIFRMPIDGGTAEQVTSDPGDEFLADLAVDDRLLVYQQHDKQSRNLWIKNVDEETAVKITDFPGHEAFPAWSPNGRSVAYTDFTEDKGMFRGLFVISRDERGRWGTPRHLRTGTFKANWSPDGRFLVASRANTIEVISAETGKPHVVYAARPNSDDPKAEEVHFSDDGRTLYFKSRNEKTQSQIWAVPATGGTPRLIVEFGDRPSTRTDLGAGQGRFFFTIDERRSNIWVADVTVP
jgi:Tol biopolymer transport system component